MKKIVVFASGSGTNAENIIKYFAATEIGRVEVVFTNNPNAKVIERARNYGIPTEIFSKEELIESKVLHKINEIQPDLIFLQEAQYDERYAKVNQAELLAKLIKYPYTYFSSTGVKQSQH